MPQEKKVKCPLCNCQMYASQLEKHKDSTKCQRVAKAINNP